MPLVSSSAVDTDFTAKLCDVYPDGRSMIVLDGILRVDDYSDKRGMRIEIAVVLAVNRIPMFGGGAASRLRNS